MSPTDARVRSAELGIPFPVAEEHYQRQRETAEALHSRSADLRSRAVAHYGGAAAFWSKYRRGDGDHSTIPGFDVWGASLAVEFPELLPGDDPAAALWAFLCTPADRIPSAAALWDRAFTAAIDETAAREVATIADMIPAPEAATLAGVSAYWVSCLAKTGKIPGRQVGRNWMVSRSAVLAFRRHPSRGRPRRSDSTLADSPF